MRQVIVHTKSEEVRKEAKLLGLPLFEELGDIPLIQIRNKEDEQKAINFAGEQLLLEFPEQKIIPLENLIAELRGTTRILVKVSSAKEVKTAMETLELGADGVVVETDDIKEVQKTIEVIISEYRIELEEAKITGVKEIGLGARACIDTCDIMVEGEGMLVGSSSQGMILVQAEVMKNPFVAPRPFRVNAGAISLYTLSSNNKTKYLEEIKAGDEVLIVNRRGETRASNLVRSKIEFRPLLLIEAESKGKVAKAVLQNAETIRVVTPEGSKAVTELKQGDKVIARFEFGGRHFGTLVKEEQVIEK